MQSYWTTAKNKKQKQKNAFYKLIVYTKAKNQTKHSSATTMATTINKIKTSLNNNNSSSKTNSNNNNNNQTANGKKLHLNAPCHKPKQTQHAHSLDWDLD